MNALGYDIKDLLVAGGFGSYATNLFLNKEPVSPDNVITIYTTGGSNVSTLDLRTIRQDTAQIRVRNIAPTSGWELIELIRSYLQPLNNFTVNGSFIRSIDIMSGPEQIKFDEKDRIILVLNIKVNR